MGKEIIITVICKPPVNAFQPVGISNRNGIKIRGLMLDITKQNMALIGIKGNIRLQCETNRLFKCLINVLMKIWFRIYWQVFNRTIMNFTEFRSLN